MTHDISTLPSYNFRHEWKGLGKTALSRLLSDEASTTQAGPAQIWAALSQGAWRPVQEDISGEMPALLALLGSFRFSTNDLGASASTEASPPPLDAFLQQVAGFLVEAGCSLTARLPDKFGSGDVMDLAMALNADEFLDRYIDRIDWKTRTVAKLPWLHYSARKGHSASMQILLRHGADPMQLDADGNTALFHASDAPCVRLLVEAGVNASHLNHAGKTASSHWTGARGIKGERASQLAAAVGKIRSTLTHEQELIQFFQVANVAPKGRLEKEIRRLKLTGAERVEGIGMLQAATARFFKDAGVSFRGSVGNVSQTWFLHVVAWPGALAAATTAELLDARIVALVDGHPQAAQDCLDRVQHSGLDEQEQWRARTLAIQRFLDGDSRVDSQKLGVLVKDLCDHPQPLAHAPLMMALMRGKGNGSYSAQYPDTKAVEEVVDTLLEFPLAPGWDHPAIVEGATRLALLPSHNNSQEQMQGHMAEIAVHAVSQGARWSPALRAILADCNNPSTLQKAFIEQLGSELDAAQLLRDAPVGQMPRRSPRL